MTLDIRRKSILFTCLILLIILSYSNTLYSPFTLDDFHSFIHSPNLYPKDLSFNSLYQLSKTIFGKSRLIPIMSFAIDHQVGKGSIVQYHLTNILIHLLNTAALFWFLSLLLKTRIGKCSLSYCTPFVFCLATTALWALNPVQTNAVTYLVQRMASLSTLFYVTSLSCYLTGRINRRNSWYFLSAFSALLALMSKQNSATLPIAILITEYILINPEIFEKIIKRIRWQHWITAALILLLITPLIKVELTQLLQGYSNRHFTLSERLLTEGRIVVFYLSLLILPMPFRMNMEHDFNISTSLISPPSTFLAILFLIGLLWSAIRYAKTYPLISFGIMWYFLNIALESTILPLELAFEHRNYLPSIGLFISLVSAVDQLAKSLSKRVEADELRKILGLFLIIVICTYSVLTTLRNNDWRDHLSLAADNLEKSPNKPRALSSYGNALAESQRHEEAINYFEKAIATSQPGNEDYLGATGNLLSCLSKLGRTEEAIARGEKFLKEMPDDINLIFYTKYLANLGILYEQKNQYNWAYEYAMMSLRLETSTDNNALVSNMVHVLNKIYDDPILRISHLMEITGDRNTDIVLKIAQVLLDIRDYEKAYVFINAASTTGKGKDSTRQLLARYRNETALNLSAQKASAIENHYLYNNDLKYRLTILSSNFIFSYYPPLSNLAGNFLQKALTRYPDDQFLALYISRWLAGTERQTEALALIEKTLLSHSDFIPLLERVSRFYRDNDMKEKQLNTYRQILSLYPGVPAWNQYETFIERMEKKPTGTHETTTEIKGRNHA